MKHKIIVFSFVLILFLAGCISNTLNKQKVSSLKEKGYSITALQDYDPTLCSGMGVVKGGSGDIGLKLQAYDFESGEMINTERTYFDFPGHNGGSGGTSNERFWCYQTDSTFPISVSVVAKGYIPIQDLNIGTVPVGKMYLVKVLMKKKPTCYYDKDNLEQFFKYIKEGFGLSENQYTIKCMDSDITRGGFVEAQGNLTTGGKFELLFRWGWCSSGGADCGWTKCFAVKDNDELFKNVKNKLCNEISSKGYHDEDICTSPAYDNTEEVRQKCLDGEFEYFIGNKKVISIVQNSGRCSSSVGRGSPDCLSIY